MTISSLTKCMATGFFLLATIPSSTTVFMLSLLPAEQIRRNLAAVNGGVIWQRERQRCRRHRGHEAPCARQNLLSLTRGSSDFRQAAAQSPRGEFIVEKSPTSAIWRPAVAQAASLEWPFGPNCRRMVSLGERRV